jgi:hypothetical protein
LHSNLSGCLGVESSKYHCLSNWQAFQIKLSQVFKDVQSTSTV